MCWGSPVLRSWPRWRRSEWAEGPVVEVGLSLVRAWTISALPTTKPTRQPGIENDCQGVQLDRHILPGNWRMDGGS